MSKLLGTHLCCRKKGACGGQKTLPSLPRIKLSNKTRLRQRGGPCSAYYISEYRRNAIFSENICMRQPGRLHQAYKHIETIYKHVETNRSRYIYIYVFRERERERYIYNNIYIYIYYQNSYTGQDVDQPRKVRQNMNMM